MHNEIDAATPAALSGYDRAAAGWQSRMAALGYLAAYRSLIATAYRPRQAVFSLLDAGCGAGDFAAAYLAERGPVAHLTLLDASQAMLGVASARHAATAARVTTLCQPVADLARAPAYDLILCAHVIEHAQDAVAELAVLRAALTPGGSILLVVSKPHWCNRLIWLRWRHQSFAPALVRAAAFDAGLRCDTEFAFASGPPSRTSRAYILTRPNPEILSC